MPEDITVGRCAVQLFDLGGHDTRRDIWPTYYPEVHGFVYVVDGADRDRISTAKGILDGIIGHKYINGKRMLILVNKQDLDGAMTTDEVADALGIRQDDPSFCVKACSAVDNEGSKPAAELNGGFKWLLSTFHEDAGSLLPRVDVETEEWREVEREERRLKRERVRKNREERERKQEETEAAAAAAAAADGGGGGDGGSAESNLAAKQAEHEANIAAAKASGGGAGAAPAPPSASEPDSNPPLVQPPPPAPASAVDAAVPEVRSKKAKKKTRRKKKQKPKRNQIVPVDGEDPEDLPHANNTSEA